MLFAMWVVTIIRIIHRTNPMKRLVYALVSEDAACTVGAAAQELLL